nr:hypothetical protein Iba_chr07fCG7190 [Ipomoea batatas]
MVTVAKAIAGGDEEENSVGTSSTNSVVASFIVFSKTGLGQENEKALGTFVSNSYSVNSNLQAWQFKEKQEIGLFLVRSCLCLRFLGSVWRCSILRRSTSSSILVVMECAAVSRLSCVKRVLRSSSCARPRRLHGLDRLAGMKCLVVKSPSYEIMFNLQRSLAEEESTDLCSRSQIACDEFEEGICKSGLLWQERWRNIVDKSLEIEKKSVRRGTGSMGNDFASDSAVKKHKRSKRQPLGYCWQLVSDREKQATFQIRRDGADTKIRL